MVKILKEEIKNKLPQWYKDESKYGLILTDDIDSLMGTAILKSKKNWDIEQVMLFKANKNDDVSKDYLGVVENATHEAIGVDFAMVNGKCFDNHLTKFNSTDVHNTESINLNHIYNINRNNYTSKYNLSTVLLLWSLYDLPKEDLSDELMMVLLAIDSSYYSYYHGFQRQNYKWLVEMLDLPEFYECQKRHKEHEFLDIQRKYGLKKKITCSKGYLATEIDIDEINELLAWECDVQLELPTNRFYRKAVFKDVELDIKGCPDSIYAICDNPFSYALTRKNKVKYSERIEC